MVIDTNIILRYLLADDAKLYAKAQAIIESKDPIRCDDVVIAECVYVLNSVYLRTKDQIVSGLQFFLNLDNVHNPSKLAARYLDIYHRENIDLADCYLIAVALAQEQPLKTFDKKMQKVYEQEKARAA